MFLVWLWSPSVNSGTSNSMLYFGCFYVNSSMYVFANSVEVFGYIVKFYVKYFRYWVSYQYETSS